MQANGNLGLNGLEDRVGSRPGGARRYGEFYEIFALEKHELLSMTCSACPSPEQHHHYFAAFFAKGLAGSTIGWKRISRFVCVLN